MDRRDKKGVVIYFEKDIRLLVIYSYIQLYSYNSYIYKIDMGSIVIISVLYLVFGYVFFLIFLVESGFCLIKLYY